MAELETEQIKPKISSKKEIDELLFKALIFSLREEFDTALEIYKKILEINNENIQANIGVVRVKSYNFNIFDYFGIENDLVKVEQVSKDKKIEDKEYLEFVAKKKAALRYSEEETLKFQYQNQINELKKTYSKNARIIDNNCTLTGQTFDSFNISVPVEIYVVGEGIKVIKDNAFEHRFVYSRANNIKKIVLPETVEKIGNYAFYGNEYINEVILPSSLVMIGKAIFQGCTNLKRIVIPNNLREIPDYTFADCKNLEEVVIGRRVKEIKDYVFSNCQNLKRIIIPGTVDKIGKFAFANCFGLNEIYFEDGSLPLEIDTDAFTGIKGANIYINRAGEYRYAGLSYENKIYKSQKAGGDL